MLSLARYMHARGVISGGGGGGGPPNGAPAFIHNHAALLHPRMPVERAVDTSACHTDVPLLKSAAPSSRLLHGIVA